MHGDKKLPVGDLICPEEGCRAELVAVEVKKTGTRFLRNRPGSSDCGHAFGRGQGGGPPSAEHRWLQQRLAMLCGDLGYRAIQEHYESRADVWVESSPPLAIEIQRWATAFARRSEAREALGAKVLWLFPESASSEKVGQELFRQPAARLRVLERDSWRQGATPWEPGYSGRVLLYVGATVMRPDYDRRTLVSAGNYDARDFLREVLKGERRWYGPDDIGYEFKSGWARPDDVERLRAVRHCAAKLGVPVPATTVTASPQPAAIGRQSSESVEQAAEMMSAPLRLASRGPKAHDHHQSPEAEISDTRAGATREAHPPTTPTSSAPARRGWLQHFWIWLTRVKE